MTTKTKSLSLVINGEVSRAFRTALTSTGKQLQGFRSQLKQLNQRAKQMETFRKLKSSVTSSEQAYQSAQVEVKRLAQELANTEKPSRKLQQSFDVAVRTAKRTKQAWQKNRDTLHQLRQTLKQAGIDTRQFVKEQNQLVTSINRVRKAEQLLQGVQRKRQQINQQKDQARSDLFEGAALAIGLSSLVKPAIAFESAMADVAKVVSFANDTALKAFATQIKELARTIPLTAVELAQIAAEGGRLGLAKKDLTKFVKTTAKLATAFDLNPQEAGEAIAKLSNIFNIPIPNIEKLGDAINQLGNNTAATERNIISVLARVGGTAKQFGLSAKQTAALADAFLALGKPPEVAATAINALLLKLQTARVQSKGFQSTLKLLGVDLNQLAETIQSDPQKALNGFLQTLSKLDKQSQAETLTKLFGQEYSDDIALLIGSLDQYEKALKLVSDESSYAGLVNDEFSKRIATTEAKLQLLKNSLSEVAINVANTLLPAINQMAGVFSNASHSMAEFADRFPKLTGVITTFIASVVALRVALIAVRFIFLSLKGIVIAITGAIAILKAQLLAAAAASTAMAGTVAVLLGLLTKLKYVIGLVGAAFAGWKIGEFLREEFTIVKQMGISLVSGLLEAFTSLKYFFKRFGEQVGFFLTQPLDAMRLYLAKLIESAADLASILPVIGDDIEEELSRLAQSIKPATTALTQFNGKIKALKQEQNKEIRAIRDNLFAAFELTKKTPEVKTKKTEEKVLKTTVESKPDKATKDIDTPKIKLSFATNNTQQILDKQLRILQDSLSQQKILLDQQYNDELLSFSDYYKQRATIEKKSLDAELKNKLTTLNTANAEQKKVIQQEIVLLRAKREIIDQNANRDSQQAQVKLNEQVQQLQVRLLNAEGKTGQAQNVRLEAEFNKLIKTLEVNGETAGVNIAKKLFTIETSKAQLKQLETEYQKTLSAMRLQESRIGLEQQAGSLTEFEAKQKILSLHYQTAEQIDVLIPKMRELSSAVGDEQTIEKLEQMKLKLTTVKEAAIVSAQQINQSFAGGVTNAFSDFVTGTQSAKDAFAQFAADFLKQIAQMILQQTILNALKSSQSGGIGGLIAAAVNHTGGLVGSTNTSRKISPIAFAGAPRMHSGGVAGLRSDEVPTILQRGEEVLTRKDPRHRSNDMGSQGQSAAQPSQTNVKIVNVIDPSVVHDYMSSSQGERVILNVLQKNPRIIQQVVS